MVAGGEGRIRTSVGEANGFTARPLWPLGYLSIVKPSTVRNKSKTLAAYC